MLKKIFIVIGLILVISIGTTSFLLATGQLKIFFEPGITKEISKTYDRDFRRLSLDFPADFNIKSSDENKILIKGGENVLDFLNITQTSRTLSFSTIESDWIRNVGWAITGANRPTITIFTTKIEELVVIGESRLTIQSAKADKFDLDFNGKQSVIIAQLQSTKSTIKSEGGGFIDISGKTEDLELNATGFGRVLLRNFEVKNATINLSSSSSAELFITEKLTAELSGSSQLKYRGSPEVIKKLSDSGDIIRL
jgi:hypothetical protein